MSLQNFARKAITALTVLGVSTIAFFTTIKTDEVAVTSNDNSSQVQNVQNNAKLAELPTVSSVKTIDPDPNAIIKNNIVINFGGDTANAIPFLEDFLVSNVDRIRHETFGKHSNQEFIQEFDAAQLTKEHGNSAIYVAEDKCFETVASKKFTGQWTVKHLDSVVREEDGKFNCFARVWN